MVDDGRTTIPLTGAPVADAGISGDAGSIPRTPVSKGYITLVTLAVFGAYVALVTPIALSLALRVEELAPGHAEYLGIVIGFGAFAALIGTPTIGMLSDRTRSKIGRRKPYLIGGITVGTVALVILALAPNLWILGAGWALTQLAWGATVLPAMTYAQADRLPEEQRGKVSGLVGLVQNVGPVIGAGLASVLIGQNLLLFLAPGAFGVVFVLLFIFFGKDDPNPALVNTEKLAPSVFFRNLVFNPRKYPSFAWNCLGRIAFNLGLSFTTTFTTFFFASRMGVEVKDIGPLVATLSFGGIIAGALGALGGGWLSDKLKRRRLFVGIAGAIFVVGALVMAFGTTVPVLVTGSLIATLATGLFMSVDQAIVFDVLPERDTDAGRFLGINNYATMLPQSIGPFLASAILVIGGGGQNYTLLFVIAAAVIAAGAIIIITRVRGTR